ncbi:hypothetical protein BDV10DRAFT_14287 [Aspergillus recurvatus]
MPGGRKSKRKYQATSMSGDKTGRAKRRLRPAELQVQDFAMEEKAASEGFADVAAGMKDMDVIEQPVIQVQVPARLSRDVDSQRDNQTEYAKEGSGAAELDSESQEVATKQTLASDFLQLDADKMEVGTICTSMDQGRVLKEQSGAKTHRPDDETQCAKEELQTDVQNLGEFALVEEPANKAFAAALPIFQDDDDLQNLDMDDVKFGEIDKSLSQAGQAEARGGDRPQSTGDSPDDHITEALPGDKSQTQGKPERNSIEESPKADSTTESASADRSPADKDLAKSKSSPKDKGAREQPKEHSPPTLTESRDENAAGGAVSGGTLPSGSGKDGVGEIPKVHGSEAQLPDGNAGEDGQLKGKSDDQNVKQTLEEQPIGQAISTSSVNNAEPALGESPTEGKISETGNTPQDIAKITNTALATADKMEIDQTATSVGGIEIAQPVSKNTPKTSDSCPWCSVYPTPAFFQCATEVGNQVSAETRFRCGLLLCDPCNIIIRAVGDVCTGSCK